MRADQRLLIRELAAKTGIPQRFVRPIVMAAGEVAAEIALARGECRWPGFGRFRLSDVRGIFTLPVASWTEEFIDVEVDRHTLRYKPYRAVRDTLDRRTKDDGEGEGKGECEQGEEIRP